LPLYARISGQSAHWAELGHSASPCLDSLQMVQTSLDCLMCDCMSKYLALDAHRVSRTKQGTFIPIMDNNGQGEDLAVYKDN